jgi:hypothetical protein
MRPRRTTIATCLALAWSLSITSPASAQTANGGASSEAERESRAAQLKQRGDDLLEAKRFEDAIAAYDAAYALSRNPALLYNRGRALQFLARYPEALDAIEMFARDAPAELRARVPGLEALLAELRAKVSTVVLRCNIDGARVMIANRQVGVTPLAAPLHVSSGANTLDVFADGYFPQHRDVQLAGSSTATLEVTLVSRSTSGLLVVTSGVAATRVVIDQGFVGVVPAEAALSPGTHHVQVEKDGYDAAQTQVVLATGERKELSLDPISRTPVYAKWWFWTGVGVVAASAAITFAALTTERGPPSGSFSPGLVRF